MPSPASFKRQFAQWLSYARQCRGLSQENLAEQLGVGGRTGRA
jgi:class 3 adenylate cyclase/transcriptional regulator with XRE-family HTH domain